MKQVRTLAALALLLASSGCGDTPTTPSPESLKSLRIDSVTPDVGSTILSTAVTIRGDGFQTGATVSVGDTVLQASVTSPQMLSVVIPPRPPAMYAVIVTNPTGQTPSVRRENGFRFDVNLPTDPVDVRISGRLLSGSPDSPVAGATIQLLDNLTPPLPTATTDDDGQFILTGTVLGSVERLRIGVTGAGLGSWIIETPRNHDEQVVLRVPGPLRIRAGQTLRAELARESFQVPCTFESVPCRSLVVEGPPGSSIDLELVPENGQTLGLIRVETFLAPTIFPTRLVVPPTTMWIMGDFGPFTLKAHHVTSPAGR